MFKFTTIAIPLTLASTLVGCQLEVATDEGNTETSQAALASCANPAPSTGSACNLGGGALLFQVRLPSGQAYVELFARQNGVQNVATPIQNSGVANGDGTTTYSFSKSGYASSDLVEFRFYSYLPASPGVFTPGPAESVWYGYSVGSATLPPSKDAAVIYSSYGLGLVPNTNFGAASTVDIGEYHLTSQGLFGYSLAGVVPAGATVTKAELVIGSAYSPSGSSVRLNLAKVTGEWQESTVTWNSKPSTSFLALVTVGTGAETRLDVTSTVAAAVAAGSSEVGFALAPSTEPSIDNVFIDAKEKSGGVPTKLSVSR